MTPVPEWRLAYRYPAGRSETGEMGRGTPSSQFPYQLGASLNASDIDYKTITLRDVMQRLNEVETLAMPNN